jgi:hypothetical protein
MCGDGGSVPSPPPPACASPPSPLAPPWPTSTASLSGPPPGRQHPSALPPSPSPGQRYPAWSSATAPSHRPHPRRTPPPPPLLPNLSTGSVTCRSHHRDRRNWSRRLAQIGVSAQPIRLPDLPTVGDSSPALPRPMRLAVLAGLNGRKGPRDWPVGATHAHRQRAGRSGHDVAAEHPVRRSLVNQTRKDN